MARSATPKGYGIQITHTDIGITGWLVGGQGEVQTFKTKKEANAKLDALLKDESYTWSQCTAEVSIYK